MDFAGDPGLLLLPNGDQPRREIAQLLSGTSQFLLDTFHLGQVRCDQADRPRADQVERIQGQLDRQRVALSELQTDLAPAVPLGRLPE